MDKAFIGGLFAALGVLVLGVISSGVAWGALLDVASVFITFGGAMATVAMQNPLSLTLSVPTIFKMAMFEKVIDMKAYILQIVTLSEKARRDGILALEDELERMNNPFLVKALQMILDGTDPEIVKRVMRIEIEELESRHSGNRGWFDSLATMGPAFGMLGTLVGLVGMLSNLGGDTSGLGKAMAAALITTLYGSFLANVFAIPVVNKLKSRTGEEISMLNMLLEGVLSIQAGENPKVILDKLVTFLAPADRKEVYDAKNEGG